MATRRDAREWTVQFLFQVDFNDEDLDIALADFWLSKEDLDEQTKEFAEALIRGVIENRTSVDEAIAKYTDNWKVDRMGAVDRNVMRMAMYELMYCEEIPQVVTINEAVDIAKYFCSRQSGRFVNGILDRASNDMEGTAR